MSTTATRSRGGPSATRSSTSRRSSPRCSSTTTSRLRRAVLALAAALVAACSPGKPSFKSVDVTGADFGRELKLTDHTGKPRTLADFKGKVVVVFFGFTQCPDVCPTTLADLAEVKKRLGKDGDALQVIFITVDPERDTQALLAQYVPGFDPSFVGLYGSAEQTAATAKEFKIFYQKVPGATPTSYTIDHTAGSFVFDREGKIRLFVRHSTGVDALVSDLKQLIG
jgi:protein SCO1/2